MESATEAEAGELDEFEAAAGPAVRVAVVKASVLATVSARADFFDLSLASFLSAFYQFTPGQCFQK